MSLIRKGNGESEGQDGPVQGKVARTSNDASCLHGCTGLVKQCLAVGQGCEVRVDTS